MEDEPINQEFVRGEPRIIHLQPSVKKVDKTVKRAIVYPLLFVLFLWCIEVLENYFQFRLISLGVIPRTIEGLPGILTAPFIHSGVDHLLSNTLPLLVVGTGLIYFYGSIAKRVILMIWLFTGFWVWLAARPEPHIGASGLIYGFVVFLFFSGLLRKDTRLMAISMLVTFLYGSLVWGILPIDQSISWESHFFGSVAGLFSAVYYRKEGPQRPKAQWEIEEEQERISRKESFPFNSVFSEPSTDLDVQADLKINYEFSPGKDKEAEENSPAQDSNKES